MWYKETKTSKFDFSTEKTNQLANAVKHTNERVKTTLVYADGWKDTAV